MTRILVIKLGAMGDFVLAFRAFAAIRAHDIHAHITLLTTAPFAELGRRSPWFDTVEVDTRPAWWDVRGIARLRRQLRGHDFIYDLQTSSRSSRYHQLAGRPPWSGVARGASHPHANPGRDAMHTLERQREQLMVTGIIDIPRPDLGWLREGGQAIAAPYALLAPGAAPHRPRKRWPETRFGELARALAGRGIAPVVVGGHRRGAAGALDHRRLPGGARPDRAHLAVRPRGPRLAGGARGRQRHRADAPGGGNGVPLRGAVLGGERSGPDGAGGAGHHRAGAGSSGFAGGAGCGGAAVRQSKARALPSTRWGPRPQTPFVWRLDERFLLGKADQF